MGKYNNADIELLATLDVDSSETEILRAIKTLENRLKRRKNGKIKLSADIDEAKIKSVIDRLQGVLKKKDLNIDTKSSVEAISREATSMLEVVQAAKKASTEKLEFEKANKKVKQSADSTANAINRERTAMQSLDNIDYILDNVVIGGQRGNTVFRQFGDTLRTAFATYTVANLLQDAIYKVINAGKEGIEVVKELNDIGVSLRMATGGSPEEVDKLIKSYNNLGQELGAVTADVANSADAWLRQGHSIEDTNELIRASIMLSKIANLESAESTEYLTSVMQAYNLKANEVVNTVSRLSAVDLESASDAGGLAKSMSRCASAAEMAGVSMDALIGYIATVKEVTQDSDEAVGNMFKSIFSRMNQIKAGKFVDLETGESLNDTEKVLNKIGIETRDTNNQLINSERILDTIGKSWEKYDSNTQKALATAVAGTYQYNKFIALMQNYSDAITYASISENSQGTAEEKFGYYLDELEAKTNSLKASLENLASTTISDELYGSILDNAKAMVDLTAETGVLKGLLVGLGTAGSIYAFTQLTRYLGEATQGFANFNEALNMTQNGTVVIQDMQRLIDLTGGLSQSQTRLLLSTNNLTDAQKIAILMNQGLTQEEAQQTIQTWGVATAQNGATAATVTFTGALRGLWATLMANPLILVTTAVTVAVTAFNKYNQSIEENKQKLRESAKEANEQTSKMARYAKSLIDLREQLNHDTTSTELLTSAFEEQLKQMGYTEAQIDDLIKKYGTLEGAIKGVTESTLTKTRDEAFVALKEAEDSLAEHYEGGRKDAWSFGKSTLRGVQLANEANVKDADKVYDYADEILRNDFVMYEANFPVYQAESDATEDILAYYNNLKTVKSYIESLASETGNKELLDLSIYSNIDEVLGTITESVGEYETAIQNLHNIDAQIELSDYLKVNDIDTQDAFNDYIAGIQNSTEYSEDYKAVLLSVANDAFPQFSKTVETATGDVSDVTTAVKDANTTLSTLQSKLDELKSTQEEYNSTGSITAETMQKLIDNNLLQYLDFSAGKLQVNTSALEAEGEAAKVNAIQKLQDAMATDLMNLATGKTEQLSNTAKTAIANLGSQAETTGNQAETAAGKLAGFAVAAQAAKTGAEGNLTGMSLEDFNTQADAIISAYMNAANGIGSVTIKTPKTTSGSNSTKNEALDNYLNSIERAYKYHEDELRYINDLQCAYDKLAKSAEEREEILDKINEAQKDYTENQINNLEHANELLENQGLKGNDAYIANIEMIKQLNHEAAESYRELLRGMGYDDETIEKTDYIQARQKGWYDADNQIKDVLQDNFNDKINDLEHKISLLENLNEQDEHNDEEGSRLTRYNRTQEINNYYRQLQEEVHNQAEELRKQGYKDDSDEIQALQNKWWEFENIISNNISNMTELKISAYTEQLEDEIEALDLQHDKEQAIIDALKQQNDLKKQIRDKQAELNAELDASKHTEEWLDEETRKLLFNEEDYSELSKELSKIDSEISRLYRDYRNEINRLDEDEWYKQEEITAQFQARLDVQMESYELLEKELEIAKKRTEYENIAKQRNTRVMVAGHWIMTPDIEKLREASKSLATIENEKENLEITNAENATIRGMEAINNATNTERLAIQNRIDMIEEMTELERKAYADRLPIDVLEGVKVAKSSNVPDEWFNPNLKRVRYTGIDDNGNLITEALPDGYDSTFEAPRSAIGTALNLSSEFAKRVLQIVPNYMSMMPKFTTPTIPNVQNQNTSNVSQYTFTGDIHIDNPIGDPNDLVHALATQMGQTFDVTKNMKQ